MESSDTAGFQFAYHRTSSPCAAAHTYGDGVGAPRAGHVHEGQDVLAPCGTPLAGGPRRPCAVPGQPSAAGNYIVIDGKGPATTTSTCT